jgi:carbamoyl-phosphate synthase small subunit
MVSDLSNHLLEKLNSVVVFADGTVFYGKGDGNKGVTVGEICFNTAATGYQEIITDPSYAGQVINFTTPHIGNVGTNSEDIESDVIYAKAILIREPITTPSNYRNEISFKEYLEQSELICVSGVDTRAITRKIRIDGAQNVAICYADSLEDIDIEALKQEAANFPTLKNTELAKQVTCKNVTVWDEKHWTINQGYTKQESPEYTVVAVDYGAKKNILRSLAEAGCKVIVVPADTPADIILKYKPDGVFLSNGPGDPCATAEYALPIISELLKSNLPIFGICLGHQLLGTALGCNTEKMTQGHRGANHPVQNLKTGLVDITSQNHGFVISETGLPSDIEVTHKSLFDGTIQGIKSATHPVFSVQGHPEASPGPHDSMYLFEQFVELMAARTQPLKKQG